jgi:hypothetical protein
MMPPNHPYLSCIPQLPFQAHDTPRGSSHQHDPEKRAY